ncbi:MAG: STAS domain-containing protein [Planctomycetota bacterium]|jgi:anti-sigma B factor antagonist
MSKEASGSLITNIRWVERFAVVDVAGEIDLAHSNRFQSDLDNILADKPERLILNLADVSYMDSSGIASLVKMLSRIKVMGASLHLVGMNDRVRSLIEITRLDQVFEIHSTCDEALES